jgi:7-carboxy-7-deazaguanine synthase
MQNGQQTINIYSIFRSINGEICKPGQGSWSTFIRLAGCNLKCLYCDTTYAQQPDSGTPMTIDEIVEKVEELGCNNVTITGGEPLLQKEGLKELIRALYFKQISIETNGSYPIIDLMKPYWVVDYKLPSSGENQKMGLYRPWFQLTEKDYIKFVIDTSNRIDYDIALTKVNELWKEGVRAQMVFSPILTYHPSKATKEYWDYKKKGSAVNTLYKWMQENQLFQVLLNVQLHKLVALQEPD